MRRPILAAALAFLGACAGAAGPGGPFPALEPYSGREVHRVRLEGDLLLPEDSVRGVISTRASSCGLGFLRVCPFGLLRRTERLDLNVLARDVVRVQLLYRDNGYYGTRVVPDVQEVSDERVDVRFRITPGDLVRLASLEIAGTGAIVDSAALRRKVPLRVGDPFRRIDFLASVDTVRNALLERGHPYAQVLRNFDIDTIADQARVELVASPGPLVTVDTILVAGTYRLDEETVRQQLPFREGSPLRASELARGQRNLFDLQLVDFAAVEVAPESLQVTPDSAELLEDSIGSTVVARLIEAPRYAVDASLGYATQDCIRGRAVHTDRNFLGGARRLEVSGLVSHVGAADPLRLGLEDTRLCSALKGPDPLTSRLDSIQADIANALNYRVAVDFVQPRLFGTRTSFLASAYAEQISELGLYLRRAQGGQVGAVRQVARGAVVSLTASGEHGTTRAPDIFYCIALEVCTRDDIERLQQARWTNSLSAGLLSNRVRLNPFPEAGFQLRAQVDVATALLGSDDRFARVYADGILYREVADGYVVSGRVAAGTFLDGLLDPQGYIPPDRRFYGGGPTHVRGYGRNQLGPTVYLRRQVEVEDEGPLVEIEYDTIRSATGGTRTLLGSLELNTPSPVFKQNLRLALFVDAGQVWNSVSNEDLSVPTLRVTPGFGARIATPVGPMRLDVGYNPYPPERGPLYEVDLEGNISGPIERDIAGRERSWFDRFVFQFGVGQGF